MIKSPFTGGEAVLKKEWATRDFRKESFEIWEHYYQCKDTGETFSTKELDQLNLQQVHNLYRALHHIPFPDEIRATREKYGLSAAKMSEVLDFGINSYRNYENGEIPSPANAKLIRLAQEPKQFARFVEEKESIFSPNAYRKVNAVLDKLLQKDRLDAVVQYLWNFHMEANEFTGFVKPTFEKVANYVLYFAQKANPLKTRLNKLLFYSDFLNFKESGFSISGCNYRAIPYGPVPSHFHELFGILEAQNYIRIEEELYDHGGVGERFQAAREFDASLFTESELKHMESVVASFEDTRTRQLIELSHQEDGWEQNHEQRELISYQQYAFHLKGI
ncbi:MAG: type II TA system antitoxin MqsA family protein [Bacteroidota bacterium]